MSDAPEVAYIHLYVSKTIGFAVAAFHSAAINKLLAP
jgi:hypothetical protein